ncbi:MAG: hypothetical protein RIF41_12400 [Polyangiaceae bacterium]
MVIDPEQALVLPAYDCLIKTAHRFNKLDALARMVAGAYPKQHQALGHPLLKAGSTLAE